MVKDKPLKPVHLVYSQEMFLLEEALERLKKMVGKSADLDFNLTELDGSETNASEIIQAADTLPFISDRRLVVVRRTDQLPPQEISILANYIENIPSHVCLVFLVLIPDEYDQKKKVKRFLIKSPLRKVVEKKGKVFEYRPPRRNEYPNWVQEQFVKHNKLITPEAARYIVETVGLDLAKLNGEIEKICLFHSGKKKLDVDEVNFLLARSTESNVFNLVEALGGKSKTKVLRILDVLLRSNEPIPKIVPKILAVITREFRLLLRTKALLERGASNQMLAEGLVIRGSKRLPSWVINRYRQQSRRFSMDELKQAHKFLLEADLALKNSKQDHRLVLETLVVNLSE